MIKNKGEKRALLLGGTCDLALCLAPKLIKKKIMPILTWRDSGGKAKIDSSLSDFPDLYETVRFDLNDSSACQTAFNQDTEIFAFLVDFAQGDYESLIAGGDEDRIGAYFSENVAARAALLKRIARGMIRMKEGRLIFLSSSAVERPAPGQGFYAAAKLASEAMYRNCGLELASKGITAAILRLGYVRAGRGRIFLDANPQTTDQIPLRRALDKEEVAEAILFLLSPGAAGINATTLTMDGGLSAGKKV
ncbi:MAG: SDR family oxidoreductase [Deltaproteobacteria bacterium]|nr:SDR family oxidoreductase [Deltaproteobacteria bacterium]